MDVKAVRSLPDIGISSDDEVCSGHTCPSYENSPVIRVIQPKPVVIQPNIATSRESIPEMQEDEEEDVGGKAYVTWKVDGDCGTSMVVVPSECDTAQVHDGSGEVTGEQAEVEWEEDPDYFEESDDSTTHSTTPQPRSFDALTFARQLRQEAEKVVTPGIFAEICALLKDGGGPLRGEDLQAYVLARVCEEDAATVMQLAFRVVFAEGGV
jgi:hypothetical protein